MLNHYPFSNIGTRTSSEGTQSRVFKFTADPHFVYNVEFTEREHDFVEVTFYLARDISSNDVVKYGRMVGVKNPMKVLNTVVVIAKEFLDRFKPHSNFIFLGFPRPQRESSLTITKRFVVYGLLAAKYFNPSTWKHYNSEETSIYLLQNPNSEINKTQLEGVYNHYKALVIDRYM